MQKNKKENKKGANTLLEFTAKNMREEQRDSSPKKLHFFLPRPFNHLYRFSASCLVLKIQVLELSAFT